MTHQHIGIYLNNKSDKKKLIKQLYSKGLTGILSKLEESETALFSSLTIDKLIDEEYKHDRVIVCSAENTSLSTMSSGQQKKALLAYLIGLKPKTMVLDDVYSNVDKETQLYIDTELPQVAKSTVIIQLFFRKRDMLGFIDRVLVLNDTNEVVDVLAASDFRAMHGMAGQHTAFELPEMLYGYNELHDPLIDLQNIRVSYAEKQVLVDLNWTIRAGEFWQLVGPNGSGKSTLLGMICGDNPKAYGQDMLLFGRKKGSGETIWDIKKHIGYFTPNMTLQFTRNETVENMLVSGLNDSIGLYIEPTDMQRDLAKAWVRALGSDFENKNFQQLSVGQQRMVMVARAMIKQPALLILDEPTIELDDENSALFIEMVHAIAAKRQVAIVYVSHRDEENLQAEHVFELVRCGNAYSKKK